MTNAIHLTLKMTSAQVVENVSHQQQFLSEDQLMGKYTVVHMSKNILLSVAYTVVLLSYISNKNMFTHSNSLAVSQAA